MRVLFTILFALFFNYCFGQIKPIQSNCFSIEKIDSITISDSISELNLVVEHRHSNPLYIANNIIIRIDSLQLDINKIYDIEVYKGPKAYNKFGLIAFNGVILIKTNQEIITTTPYEIKMTKFPNIENKVLFAINGDLVSDSLIKVGQNSIMEIEFLSKGLEKGYNPKYTDYSCINIWTLTKDERIPLAAGCSGMKIRKD